MLKRFAAVAALLSVPFAAVAPAVADVSAAPPAAEDEASPDEAESPEPDEEEAEGEAVEGVSVAYGLSADPRTWQFGSTFMVRNHPWGNWSEGIIGFTSRNQVIEPNGAYAVESAGLHAALGVQAWFLRLGMQAELDWVKRIVQNSGKLSFTNTPGFLVEPYIGTELPFLNTPFTKLDARLYVPVTTFAPTLTMLTPDPAYGPRIQLNLWVGLPNGPDDEDMDEDEDGSTEDNDEEENSTSSEDEDEEMEAPTPAPTATPKPAPKPTPVPAPKKPAHK